MKCVISILIAVTVGYLANSLGEWLPRRPRLSPDAVTQALRRAIEKRLTRDIPLLRRYIHAVAPLLKELNRPALDLPSFLGLQLLLGLVFGVLASCAFPSAALVGLPVSCGLGMVLPYIGLRHLQKQHHRILLKALPDCLELVAIVIEAGLDLSAGLQLYLEKGPAGPLRLLLQETENDIRLGRSRTEAFSALGKKTQFGPLREVSRGITQALAIGTSLGPFFKRQAVSLRVKRMQLAEKQAAEAPLKVLFPLFVFIFPTIFIVLLGPLAWMFARGEF